MAEVVKNID